LTNICWHCAERTARLLERDECEAVLGDLQETGENAWSGLLEIAGLVLRRRLALWKDWRPWLASFGLALPCSLLLRGFSLTVSQTYQRLIDATIFNASGLRMGPGFLLLLCNLLLLIAWSWTGGYVMGSLSRRTIKVSAALACAPCVFCLARFRVESLSRFSLLLFILPAIWGVIRGLRIAHIRLGAAFALAMAITLLTLPTWTRPGAWIPNWALSWPAWYLVLTACRRPSEKGGNPWPTS
jgi:hypothetical protein